MKNNRFAIPTNFAVTFDTIYGERTLHTVAEDDEQAKKNIENHLGSVPRSGWIKVARTDGK